MPGIRTARERHCAEGGGEIPDYRDGLARVLRAGKENAPTLVRTGARCRPSRRGHDAAVRRAGSLLAIIFVLGSAGTGERASRVGDLRFAIGSSSPRSG